MNERRFKELLNFYLDHEIGAGEAAELEAEVMRNPERRRVYHAYCRLQSGCVRLGEQARTAAPGAQRFLRSLDEAERKMANPPRRESLWRAWPAGAWATAAMAACVVFVVVQNQPDTPDSKALLAEAAQEPLRPVAVSQSMAGASSPGVELASLQLKPVLASASLSGARNLREAEIVANDREAYEWMKRVDELPVRSVIVDDQVFQDRATLQPDNRVFHSGRAIQGGVEFTGYQFQR